MNIDDKVTHLKLSRKGDAFSFAVSPDGKEWTEIKSREIAGGEIDMPKKLKVDTSPIPPTRCPLYSAPCASAASSRIAMPCSFANATNGPISAGCP